MPALHAARSLLGILTPQANTTVEPELALLLPPWPRHDQRKADQHLP